MEIIITGGPVMFFLIMCSISAIAILVNRLMHLHRAQIDIEEFMSGLRNELVGRRITEAVGICEETPGPAANVLRAGIMHHADGRLGMESAMRKASVYEVAKMERGVAALATIAVVSPILGLLGTVLALIGTFRQMSLQGGLILNQQLASGMWEALFATAFGLSIAVPVYISYNYFVSRINRITRDMEIASDELISILAVD